MRESQGDCKYLRLSCRVSVGEEGHGKLDRTGVLAVEYRWGAWGWSVLGNRLSVVCASKDIMEVWSLSTGGSVVKDASEEGMGK